MASYEDIWNNLDGIGPETETQVNPLDILFEESFIDRIRKRQAAEDRQRLELEATRSERLTQVEVTSVEKKTGRPVKCGHGSVPKHSGYPTSTSSKPAYLKKIHYNIKNESNMNGFRDKHTHNRGVQKMEADSQSKDEVIWISDDDDVDIKKEADDEETECQDLEQPPVLTPIDTKENVEQLSANDGLKEEFDGKTYNDEKSMELPIQKKDVRPNQNIEQLSMNKNIEEVARKIESFEEESPTENVIQLKQRDDESPNNQEENKRPPVLAVLRPENIERLSMIESLRDKRERLNQTLGDVTSDSIIKDSRRTESEECFEDPRDDTTGTGEGMSKLPEKETVFVQTGADSGNEAASVKAEVDSEKGSASVQTEAASCTDTSQLTPADEPKNSVVQTLEAFLLNEIPNMPIDLNGQSFGFPLDDDIFWEMINSDGTDHNLQFSRSDKLLTQYDPMSQFDHDNLNSYLPSYNGHQDTSVTRIDLLPTPMLDMIKEPEDQLNLPQSEGQDLSTTVSDPMGRKQERSQENERTATKEKETELIKQSKSRVQSEDDKEMREKSMEKSTEKSKGQSTSEKQKRVRSEDVPEPEPEPPKKREKKKIPEPEPIPKPKSPPVTRSRESCGRSQMSLRRGRRHH